MWIAIQSLIAFRIAINLRDFNSEYNNSLRRNVRNWQYFIKLKALCFVYSFVMVFIGLYYGLNQDANMFVSVY